MMRSAPVRSCLRSEHIPQGQAVRRFRNKPKANTSVPISNAVRFRLDARANH